MGVNTNIVCTNVPQENKASVVNCILTIPSCWDHVVVEYKFKPF